MDISKDLIRVQESNTQPVNKSARPERVSDLTEKTDQAPKQAQTINLEGLQTPKKDERISEMEDKYGTFGVSETPPPRNNMMTNSREED